MRYAWVLPAGGGLVAALAAAAAIAGSGHFRVVNDNDRYAIDKMWVAEVNDEDWTAMTMTYPIKAGTRSGFAVNGIADCTVDIRVKLSDGSEQEFDDIDACKDEAITVR